MSINSKKLSELIDREVSTISSLSTEHKEILAELCKSIYMLESSTEQVSAQSLIEEISGKISNSADRFKTGNIL